MASTTFRYTVIDGREYRYSVERRNSGTPVSIQFFGKCGWRDLRNVSRFDQLCRVAQQVAA